MAQTSPEALAMSATIRAHEREIVSGATLRKAVFASAGGTIIERHHLSTFGGLAAPISTHLLFRCGGARHRGRRGVFLKERSDARLWEDIEREA